MNFYKLSMAAVMLAASSVCVAAETATYEVSASDGETTEYPETLYLLGDATPGGWDNATPMENLGNGVYQYVGVLKANKSADGVMGALQIYGENPKDCGTNSKAYGPGESRAVINCWGVSNDNLTYYESNRPGDCFYQVQENETNNYILTVDLATMKIKVQLNNLYFADRNSNFTFVQMENEGNRVFTHKGYFPKDNAFIFAATAWWTTKIGPKNENGDAKFGLAEFTDNALVFGSNCTMKNLYAGYYVVSADLNNMTLTTRTYNPDPIEKLYVCCNGEYKEMTGEGDGVYAWSGELNGDFTITTGESEYPCYMASEETVAVPEGGLADSQIIYNTLADNGLNKWNNSNSGNYTVRVNTNAMTLSVQKGVSVGINGIDSESTPVVYYDMMGRKVQNPVNGIYVRVQGANSQKIVVKNVQ